MTACCLLSSGLPRLSPRCRARLLPRAPNPARIGSAPIRSWTGGGARTTTYSAQPDGAEGTAGTPHKSAKTGEVFPPGRSLLSMPAPMKRRRSVGSGAPEWETMMMGEIRASVTLENRDVCGAVRLGLRAEADVRRTRAEGVVDTGAVTLVIPEEVPTELGLEHWGTRTVVYADERREERPVTDVTIEIRDLATRVDVPADAARANPSPPPSGLGGPLALRTSTVPAKPRWLLAIPRRHQQDRGGLSPLHVAAYIRTHPGSAPIVKQHLAAIRMLCRLARRQSGPAGEGREAARRAGPPPGGGGPGRVRRGGRARGAEGGALPEHGPGCPAADGPGRSSGGSSWR